MIFYVPFVANKTNKSSGSKTKRTRHSMIGSPERVKIQRSSIPKIRKIHVCVWKLEVKNSQNSQFWQKMAKISPNQNFPGTQSMISSKKAIRTTSIPKIGKINSGVWKLQVKTSQNCQFWSENGQILDQNRSKNDQIFFITTKTYFISS